MADEVSAPQSHAEALKMKAAFDNRADAMHFQLKAAEIAALQGPGPVIKLPPSAAELGTPEMIMELLKRGFCVFKMPDSGNPREAFDGPTDAR